MADRVVVGMSGGVDSSVAAALLVEQGCEVVGVTLRVWPWREPEEGVRRFGSCCSPETVEDARQVARALGIPYYLLNSEREFDETVIQEICFIPDDDYRRFLRARVPEAFRPGPLVDANGTVLGEHRGIASYTVGQRRGLGLSRGTAAYVTAIDPERNAVVVGGAH